MHKMNNKTKQNILFYKQKPFFRIYFKIHTNLTENNTNFRLRNFWDM